MENKIRIKIGPIEVEYEGSETFIKQDLLEMTNAVIQLYKTSEVQKITNSIPIGPTDKNNNLELSTGSIAAKLVCKNGSDLIIAAAAHLTFVSSKSKFSRTDIIKEMQSATAYCKKSHLSNLTQNLNALIRARKLNEPSAGYYSLPAAQRDDIRKKLD